MVFKSMYFWCDTRSKIAPGLPGSRNKNPASLIFSLRLDLIRFVISVGELSNTDYLLVLREEKRDDRKTGTTQMMPNSRVLLGTSLVPTGALSRWEKTQVPG